MKCIVHLHQPCNDVIEEVCKHATTYQPTGYRHQGGATPNGHPGDGIVQEKGVEAHRAESDGEGYFGNLGVPVIAKGFFSGPENTARVLVR